MQNGFGNCPLRPLFRWVGGKQHLTHALARLLPNDLGNRLYREPFFGAGSLFFFVQPKRAVLSDLNVDLMNAYRSIRGNPVLVARYLRSHALLDSKAYYYKVREQYNRSQHDSAAQAARFLYLNRTCFNGIFRVNLAGKFNVPYGQKSHPIFPGSAHLRAGSTALHRARLRDDEFEAALEDVSAGDFIYLDPPYPALNGTSFFAHYTKSRFQRQDQERLAAQVRELDRAKCLVLVSNADLQWIRRLYRGFNQTPLAVTRYVRTGHEKHKVSELMITNYDSTASAEIGP